MPATTDDSRQTVVLLAAITAFGAALRFYGLEVQSLSNDELATWTEASPAILAQVVHRCPKEHPPGFSILIHFWISYLGDSEAMLRMPSAIFGTLTIPAMFLLGRRVYGDAEGLIASALVAVLWMPIYYSQEARAYTLLMLCAALSTYWLIDLAGALLHRRALPLGAAAAYFVTAVIAFYAHYFGVLLIALQGAFVGIWLLVRRGSWLRLGMLYALVVLTYIPWISRASGALAKGAPDWMKPPTPSSVWDCMRFMFNDSDDVFLAFLGLGGVAIVLELWRTRGEPYRFRKALRSPTMVLLLWVIVPIVIIYLRSIYIAPAFANRSFIIIAPALYLLAAHAITRLALPHVTTFVGVCTLLVLLGLHLVVEKDYYRRSTKAEFRQAAAFLVARDDPAAVTVVVAGTWATQYFDYYLEQLGSPRRVDTRAAEIGDADKVIRLVDEKAPDHVWFLAGHRRLDHRLIDVLKRRFQLIDEHHFKRADAWRFRYERKTPAD